MYGYVGVCIGMYGYVWLCMDMLVYLFVSISVCEYVSMSLFFNITMSSNKFLVEFKVSIPFKVTITWGLVP